MSRDASRDSHVQERMRLTFELFEAAEQMMRLNDARIRLAPAALRR